MTIKEIKQLTNIRFCLYIAACISIGFSTEPTFNALMNSIYKFCIAAMVNQLCVYGEIIYAKNKK